MKISTSTIILSVLGAAMLGMFVQAERRAVMEKQEKVEKVALLRDSLKIKSCECQMYEALYNKYYNRTVRCEAFTTNEFSDQQYWDAVLKAPQYEEDASVATKRYKLMTKYKR